MDLAFGQFVGLSCAARKPHRLSDEPKYLVPANLKKSLVLFNYHRVVDLVEDNPHLILVEGFFDLF